MSFRPESIRGLSPVGGPGQIDYRLVRRQTIDEFKRGRLGRRDICDAHPELLRAARGIGESTTRACPICEEEQLVLVSFAFGPRLPPHGRCITGQEVGRLSARRDEATCYVVEVCPGCSWNHLVRTFLLGGRRPS